MQKWIQWQRLLRMFGCALAVAFSSCAGMLHAPPEVAGRKPEVGVRRIIAERASAVVVTNRKSLDHWRESGFSEGQAPRDADGGSAAPITHDGYFLTADHVLQHAEGKNVFVLYGGGVSMRFRKARVVWRSSQADLAVLHIQAPTRYYYKWTPPDQWLPRGTTLLHGGISTGFRHLTGRLGTAIPPESAYASSRKFKLDIPLQPGDSGGPVVDDRGLLVGVNSSIELLVPMETPIFIDAEAVRPNTRRIAQLIQNDRMRWKGR